ncbi:flagellar filament capping protein FliD [Alkalihalobacillus hemicellulosilyticus]|uniref:Flagellar hook-associated protein 2 n=1 Tax=Halalkalibacter hemicellulosilyticusJCM 9152 TaxID=1236971 RepID=W4QIT8_9BACI|nr:flagellar filament capping protein FliD [Halalkalibacter hemicellulosilyticus]GAE31553.1 flagellar hook-associated protein FliD [Halalkalibacter hemicellulosilyticusJCM 9152]
MVMRMTGFSSGMDIEQIVSDLMRARRIPVDKLIQDRQAIEWKTEDYREINRKLNTFHTNIFDTILRPSNMLAKTVSSTNSGLVSATANSEAGNMSLRISKVTQLATAASNNSTGRITQEGEQLSTTQFLMDQPFNADSETVWKKGIVRDETIRMSSASNVVSLNPGDETIINPEDAVVKVNGRLYHITEDASDLDGPDGEQLVYFNANEGTLQFKNDIAREASVSVTYITEAPADATHAAYHYTTGNVTTYDRNGEINDKFVVRGNQSLTSVFSQLNRSSAGVNGFYDQETGKVSVSRTQTGQFNPNAEGTEGFTGEMRFDGALFTELFKLDSEQETAAQNARFTMNGLETSRQSNTFTVSGMTVTLKEEFTQEVTLNASTDTDRVMNTIKSFVDEYNELLDHMNGKLSENRNRDYRPLTDEQRAAMSEDEIEKWEERARSGLLSRDPALRSILDKMRMDMYTPVNGELETVFNQLTTIGITTTRDYLQGGKLEINEEKLRQAIEADAEGVFQLFAGGESDGPANEQGIARRIRNSVDNGITTLAERAGGFKGRMQPHQYTLGRNLNDLNDRISDFERRLTMVEDRYWRQFNAMEAAMARANQQAETLFSALMPMR